MDEQQEELLAQRLSLERAKLTEEQRYRFDQYCHLLSANEAYSPEYAFKGLEAIKDLDGIRLRKELQRYADQASQAVELETHRAWIEDERARDEQYRLAEGPGKSDQQQELLNPRRQTDETRKQQLFDSAKALGERGDVESGRWVAQAETVDRQRHQHGRYDALRGGPPQDSTPSGKKPSGPDNPQNSPSPAPRNPNQPLSANEVMARFTDPALMDRYQQNQQQRDQESKSALTSADPATRRAAQGNSSTQSQDSRNAMDYFVTGEMQKKAEEEREARANGQNKGQSRGGRGR